MLNLSCYLFSGPMFPLACTMPYHAGSASIILRKGSLQSVQYQQLIYRKGNNHEGANYSFERNSKDSFIKKNTECCNMGDEFSN